jgi:hypothetical protein
MQQGGEGYEHVLVNVVQCALIKITKDFQSPITDVTQVENLHILKIKFMTTCHFNDE